MTLAKEHGRGVVPAQAAGSGMAHIGALDGVRALSIILVILTHTAPLGPASWNLNDMAGPMGMSLFFCLSGFLIVSLLNRNADALSFLIHRVLRIVPAVAMYMVVMVVLFGIGWRAVAENLLFVTNYFYEGRGDGTVAAPMSHLWSLSVEMQFYIAMALAALALGRRCVWLVIPAALLITATRIGDGVYLNIATHRRADEILAGGILALVAIHRGDAIRRALAGRGRAAAVLAAAVALWMLSCHPAGGWVMYLRPYLAALVVGIVLHSRIPPLHRLLEGRAAAYIARISYALYIYHPLMIWGWMNTGTDVERYLLKRPVSYALTWAAAHASTFWWEARWQALARRLTAGRQAQARPAGGAA